MIKLYTWGTPNGKKVSIMLEEIAMPYEVYPVNIGKDEQFKPEYLAINPNNKIPSIIDTDGPYGKPFTLFESGAILMYLAEKSGRLWPADMRHRSRPGETRQLEDIVADATGCPGNQDGFCQ